MLRGKSPSFSETSASLSRLGSRCAVPDLFAGISLGARSLPPTRAGPAPAVKPSSHRLAGLRANADLDNLAKPLSHAALIARYLANQWPDRGQSSDLRRV